ncbi:MULTISPECIES: hypothetical protein [Mesotoga]|uniref:thioesterase family protein n=1 Tax=Mesotoga TaxID=1184396 RepID=UPI001BD5C36C|nr:MULTISPECIES: hypothetical protein [Mesotoga]MCP5456377.1 hypothetical protein [Thermotogota bacterium]MCP5460898.1 hypothetical protein [Thermotogota bacterium]HNQ70365.1 hypothetical protein [Mesotoga prima]HNS75184.1 hypothetical protein [Mesotoga prima]HOP36697.1 hypothetical protein [Mesotoga prima]
MLDLERLRSLENSEFTQTVIPTDVSLRWSERYDVELLNLLSTSGLMKIVHSCGHNLISDFESDSLVSVVSETSVKHYSPILMEEELVINIRIVSVSDSAEVHFSGSVVQLGTEAGAFEFSRKFISVDFFRRAFGA